MAIKARIAKQVEADLVPGEQVVATAACQMKGTMAAGALGGAAGMLIARRRGRGAREEAEAAGFPLAQNMALVVTDRRVLVRSGKKAVGEVPAADLAGAVVVKENAISPWTIRIDLANGHKVLLEANRFAGPGELVQAIDRLAGNVPP